LATASTSFFSAGRNIADLGLGAAAVLGGQHAQSAMYLIGQIPDGHRGHDVRLPGVLGLIPC
jgi:hypothetical protein